MKVDLTDRTFQLINNKYKAVLGLSIIIFASLSLIYLTFDNIINSHDRDFKPLYYFLLPVTLYIFYRWIPSLLLSFRSGPIFLSSDAGGVFVHESRDNYLGSNIIDKSDVLKILAETGFFTYIIHVIMVDGSKISMPVTFSNLLSIAKNS